jgi:hypothetical protein
MLGWMALLAGSQQMVWWRCGKAAQTTTCKLSTSSRRSRLQCCHPVAAVNFVKSGSHTDDAVVASCQIQDDLQRLLGNCVNNHPASHDSSDFESRSSLLLALVRSETSFRLNARGAYTMSYQVI